MKTKAKITKPESILIGDKFYGIFQDENSIHIGCYRVEKVYKNGDVKFHGCAREKLNRESNLITLTEVQKEIKEWLNK